MKVIISENKEFKLVDYKPTLLRHKEKGFIAFFTSFSKINDGIISEMVQLSGKEIGSKLCNWNVDKFEPLDGEITLSNN